MSAPSSYSKELITGLGFVLLVGIVLLIFYFTTSRNNGIAPANDVSGGGGSNYQTPSGVANTPGSNPVVTTPAKTVTKTPPKTTTVAPSAPKSYIVDSAKFKASGYYIQIYPGCQATPGNLTVKKGSQVMFDNRNDKGHTIAYKGVNHWLGAYGYAILKFDYVGDNYVTCDGGGSAKVTVVP
jgi:hypothetical protein